MTHARDVQPGQTHLITRRCIGRMFQLRPDRFTTECFRYLLAYAAQEHGILVYECVAMSNHYHAVIHDPRGEYPDFFQLLHGLMTRALNAYRKRDGTMWERKATHEITLLEPATVLAKMAYVAANPATSDLVSKATAWPGFTTAHYATGQTLVVKRPRELFNGNTILPDAVELHIAKPVEFADVSKRAFDKKLRRATKRLEQAAASHRRDEGKSVLGADAAKRQSLDARPVRKEPFRRFIPRIVASTRELFRAQREARRAFLKAYRSAREKLKAVAGTRKKRPVFPAGTWLLWRQGLVLREPS